MLRIIFLFTFLFASSVSRIHAQSALDKPRQSGKQLEVLPITDIAGTANSLLIILKQKLALSDSQGPNLTGLLTDFLKSKTGIIPLAKTSPADYTNKFSGIKEKLSDRLKTVLTSAQYSKFLGLKPKGTDSDNLLNHLFF